MELLGEFPAFVVRRFRPERTRIFGTDFGTDAGNVIEQDTESFDAGGDQFVSVDVLDPDAAQPRLELCRDRRRFNQEAARRLGIGTKEFPSECDRVRLGANPGNPQFDPAITKLGPTHRLDVVPPPAERTAGNEVGLFLTVVDIVPGEQDPVEEEFVVPGLGERSQVLPLPECRQQCVAGLQEEEVPVRVDSPGGGLGSSGELLDDGTRRFLAPKLETCDSGRMHRRLDVAGKIADVRRRDDVLRHQQTDDLIGGRDNIEGLAGAVRIIRKEVGRRIAMWFAAIGTDTKSPGKDLVEFDRHAFETDFHSGRTDGLSFFNASQVPTIAEFVFETDPVTDLDTVPIGKGRREDQFCPAASAVAVKFEPTLTDRLVREQDGWPAGIRTVIQNASFEGHGVGSNSGCSSNRTRWRHASSAMGK